jgi:CMP-N,N'-diacetyllegionaminic acid synthase
MKSICIIPARGGSKGLPRKNAMILAGQPLISWPVKAALKSGVIDTVFVTTDDEEIGDLARQAGAEVPFLRPTSLALDDTTTEQTLTQALNAYEEFSGEVYDICVFQTCTDIFRRAEWISEAVNLLTSQPELESVFSACATHKNYWELASEGGWERVLPWMREYSNRQVRRKIYREDTGLGCASRAELWRQGRRVGDNVEIIKNELSETAIDIHTEFDLFLAEQAIDYLKKNEPERVALFM